MRPFCLLSASLSFATGALCFGPSGIFCASVGFGVLSEAHFRRDLLLQCLDPALPVLEPALSVDLYEVVILQDRVGCLTRPRVDEERRYIVVDDSSSTSR
jgi:hypothetical protein